jgi:hypothetical protein
MKKPIQTIILTALLGSSFPIHALDGQGTVEQIKICGTGSGAWLNYLFFRLSDGSWFGLYGHYYNGSSAQSATDTTASSAVYFAMASKIPLKVRATYSNITGCGITAAMFWQTQDNYIQIGED